MTATLTTTTLPAVVEPEAETPDTAGSAGYDDDTGSTVEPDVPWVVLLWDDPINLVTYVTHVLQVLFGYSKDKATELTFEVHHNGRAVVSSGQREKAELDVFRLHEHGLWATMQQDS